MTAWRIIEGDCRESLRALDAGSVQTCVTSPPYFGLRDYGTGEWEGGDPACDHISGMARQDTGRETPGGRGGSFRGGTVQFRDLCGKCDARRVDRQIGLEPTPDEFVAALVGVFREVRRVLRDDGTVWLNLGDSYAQYDGQGNLDEPREPGLHGSFRVSSRLSTVAENRGPGRHSLPPGLKRKDLVGIPWMVAFALRQPYYDGDIKREQDRIWLAAMIDTEGSIGVNWQRAGDHRPRDYYSLSIKVSNTSRAIVERCAQIAGCGSALLHDRRGRDCFAWSVYGEDARRVLREAYPYLVAKQQEARLGYGPLSHHVYEAMRLLHAGADTTIDAPAPPDCWTPGWYLRSDIIWSKPNPMPESVTDRPTKAHEYVFLLSKGPRYFYDADAVREPHEESSVARSKYDITDMRSGTATRVAGEKGPKGDTAVSRAYPAMNPLGRNRRSVWTVPTRSFPGAHFATFPPKLIEPCILAGSREGDTVLDPFAGSGTTGMVALRHGRSFVGCELNPAYAVLARERIIDDSPLLNSHAESSPLAPAA